MLNENNLLFYLRQSKTETYITYLESDQEVCVRLHCTFYNTIEYYTWQDYPSLMELSFEW